MKQNEQIVYDYLKSYSEKNGNPVNLSFSSIREKVTFKREAIVKIIRKKIKWQPSRKGVNDVLIRLEEQGLVKLDYSNKTKPLIIVK